MDFGFNRFLEMFEDRFGRHATTVLIAVVGLALFGYSLRVIVETVTEFAKTMSGFEVNNKISEVLQHGISLVITFILLWILVKVLYRYYFQRKIEAITQKITEHQQEIMKAQVFAKKAIEESEQNYAKAETLYSKSEEIRSQAEAALVQAQQAIKEARTSD